MSSATARDLVLSSCECWLKTQQLITICALTSSFLTRHCKRSLVLTGSAVRELKPCAASSRSSTEKTGPRRQDDRRTQLLKRAESFDGAQLSRHEVAGGYEHASPPIILAVTHDIASGEITEQAVKEATRMRYSTRFCSSS